MYRQSEKNLLSSNISSTCSFNTANFRPLAAEICSLVWGTPGNFNGFRVLAALLHGNLVVGVSQTVALNRGRHLYSAGRLSRWAFAHISSCKFTAAESKSERILKNRLRNDRATSLPPQVWCLPFLAQIVHASHFFRVS